MKRHRFNAKKTRVRNINFPSKLEADTYELLFERQMRGEIANLDMQCRVDPPRCESCKQYATRPVRVDFRYLDLVTNEDVWAEAKGIAMPAWNRFVKWWKKDGPGKLEIYKAGRKGPVLTEEIWPKND